ncbi:MAG TPA: MerR family transcriptional regulator [Rhizomicrobium sp.]|nr:MerR family transcriptional regulator [Rhizomicrobium sp.]
MTPSPHLSPSETARRFGISVKALRLYEQRGLLKPLRSEAGWRTYGPDQVTRLHQILTLKRLGLPLAKIGEILAGPDALEPVLALQEQVLARDSEQLSRALVLVRAARAKLKASQALSIDDLATLNKETVMTRIVGAKEMNQLLTPFADRHFSPEEREALKQKVGDRDQVKRTVEELVAEGEAVMQAGDPTSPAAQDLARRFAAMAEQFIGGDPAIKAKTQAAWNDAMQDPAVTGRMALNLKIFAFLDQAITHLKAQAK